MSVIKFPDREGILKEAIEASVSRSNDFILISIGDVGVEVGSTLTSERELFYLELAKTLVIKDWLGDDQRMISLNTDEIVSDTDYELIEAFCIALIDKDSYSMNEVLYLLNEKMNLECICLEEDCVCGSW